MIKISENFMLREFADEYIVVPTGEAAAQFNGMMNLTETAAFIWREVQAGKTREEIVDNMLKEFDIDVETATRDVNGFIDELIVVGIASEE